MFEVLENDDPSDWRALAACRDSDSSVFFPEVGSDVARIAAAKEVCAGCPVREDCLSFAVETNQSEGIWGGRTPSERRTLRRRWLKELRKAS